MKTLADLKRKLKSVLNSDTQLVKVTIWNCGLVFFDYPPSTVVRAQSKDFAINRNGKPSWLSFDSAKDWEFPSDTMAVKKYGQKEAYIEFLPSTRPNQ